MAYKEKVLDHYENPRNVGSLDKNRSDVGTAMVGAPACGDVMKLQIQVNDQDIIIDAKFKTFGCASAIASSSLSTEWLKGKHINDAGSIKNIDIAKELELPPVKYHCSVLAEDAIKSAIEDYKEKQHGISFNEQALAKISRIFNENHDKTTIRFIAKDGGCSGKKYDISLENEIGSHIKIQTISHNKHILIDKESFDLFKNCTIDYMENDLESRFVFNNPNAKNACGCGASFN